VAFVPGLAAQLAFAVHSSPLQLELALMVNVEASNCASRWAMYHWPASMIVLATKTTCPLHTMTPPVPPHDAEQLAGVMLQDSLSWTWHVTLQTMFSVAVQLVAHSVEQVVVGGDRLHEYEHCPWQPVTQSVSEAAPQLWLLVHSVSHWSLQ
jgi:hypothetical protein